MTNVNVQVTTGVRSPVEFWLDGNSVMCACPDCAAPMSIRMWLLIADCWQCGCSVELTKEQEQELHSLLGGEQARTPHQRASPHAHSATAPPRQRPTSSPDSNPGSNPATRPQQRLPLPNRATTTRPVPPLLKLQSTRRSLKEWLNQMPAWLVSLLFHMALLALLALLFFDGEKDDQYITLSLQVNRLNREGGEIQFQNPNDQFEFDLPVPPKDVPDTPRQAKELAMANQDAKELRVDPASRLPQLPALQQVKAKLRSSNATERTLLARDPRVRVEMVKREGGTTLTEAAVARGLRWMASHQGPDGRWRLRRFASDADCDCRGGGSLRSDSAATSLCLLPFLGAGQTHQTGIYQDTVAKGLRWLIQNQLENGDLSKGSSGNAKMYAHGQAAIVLCEAYALTRDEQLHEAAQRSIDFIVNSQHAEGGWRYKPGEEGDTSVLGWQLMALQSARAAGLTVPTTTLELAGSYLDSVQFDDGSRYAYQPGRRPTYVMTAEALLCRMYLGWQKDYAGLQQGVRYLVREQLPSRRHPNYYYWYYATQVVHHFGGKSWDKWNLAMRDILVESQERRGHEAGSWDPRGGHASQAGRLYSTALAVCTLEVYYRHAPIFRQIELE